MKPIFHPKLINNPMGDPGLLVQFMYEKRALLFDLGNLNPVTNSTLLKVSHVFVSHTHIDHFIGFDQMLRVNFGRGKTLSLYGPENFITNVQGKLAGFTWNLVDKYNESITIDVTEVHEDHLCKARFRAVDKFEKTDERQEPFVDNLLLDETSFTVHAAILEHRVPCLGFALKEKLHVNVMKDRLDARNYPPGPWLNELKQAICQDKPDDFSMRVPVAINGNNGVEEIPLGKLKKDILMITPGQKIGYVVDTVYTEKNKSKIVDLVRDADCFFCESPFLADERERARERCHLTSEQAGLLAKEAGAKRLRIFHFSSKHTGRQAQFYKEAREVFQGDMGDGEGILVKASRKNSRQEF